MLQVAGDGADRSVLAAKQVGASMCGRISHVECMRAVC